MTLFCSVQGKCKFSILCKYTHKELKQPSLGDLPSAEHFWPFLGKGSGIDKNQVGIIGFLSTSYGLDSKANSTDPLEEGVITVKASEFGGTLPKNFLASSSAPLNDEHVITGKDSWFSIHLGEWYIAPTAYSIYAGSVAEYPRRWRLQGQGHSLNNPV